MLGKSILSVRHPDLGVSPPWVRIPPSPPVFRITIAFIELERTGIHLQRKLETAFCSQFAHKIVGWFSVRFWFGHGFRSTQLLVSHLDVGIGHR